ncbi:uncharacterized protein [Procambarus clarkii]|uniref:uncharacterized protein n=1 Tax=Procambarus clarkii TaxID=6728 RepID=UPI0037431BA9
MYEDKIQDQLDPLIKQISQAGTQSNVSSSTHQGNANITHIAAELPKNQIFDGLRAYVQRLRSRGKLRTQENITKADISKAFLRVGLQEENRDFTKFLWVVNPEDINSPIVIYRFSSVLFGAMSSPFLLQATLDTHLKKS